MILGISKARFFKAFSFSRSLGLFSFRCTCQSGRKEQSHTQCHDTTGIRNLFLHYHHHASGCISDYKILFRFSSQVPTRHSKLVYLQNKGFHRSYSFCYCLNYCFSCHFRKGCTVLHTGGSATSAQKVMQRLAKKISEKRDELNADTINYISTELSFALLRSSIVSLKGYMTLNILNPVENSSSAVIDEGRF